MSQVVDHPLAAGNLLVLPNVETPPVPGERVGDVAWYVPYTQLHPRTVEAAPVDAIWADVSSGPNAYFHLLNQIWAAGQTFALLEHDVVCRPDIINEFETCPEPWCMYIYSDLCCPGCREAWRNHIGCTRFRAELMQAVPDAVASIPEGERDWHNLCDGVGNHLRAAGYSHHWHEPPVLHKQHINLETWLR